MGGPCDLVGVGKERLLRLPRLLKNAPSRLAAWGLIGCLTALTGCNVPSFVDPSETSGLRVSTGDDPIIVDILDELDPVLEEGSRQFVNAGPPLPGDMITEPSDYVIGPGDVVTITVSDLQGPGLETVKTTNVSGTGNITLPLLQDPIRAEGLTENELQRAIVEAYRQAGIQERAEVSASVVQARQRAFRVLGAVARPSTYVITDEDYRLLDALTDAGDVTNPLLNDLYIIRKPERPRSGAGGAGDEGGGQNQGEGGQNGGNGADEPPDDLAPPSSDSRRLPKQMRRAAYLQAEGEPGDDPLAPDATAEPGDEPAVTDEPAGEELPAEEMPADDDPASRVGRVDGEGVVVQPGEGADPAGLDLQPPVAREPFEFDDMPREDAARIIRIPLDRLKAGDLRYNVAVRPRDTIIVPPGSVGFYYMEGHVLGPGAYQMTGPKVTLREAIWAARGLDALAIPQRTDIVRDISGDRKMYVRVDLARIFAGKAPDIYLKPGDEVNVGTNFFAPFLAAARNGFRMTYGFGFLYDRNYGEDEDNRR